MDKNRSTITGRALRIVRSRGYSSMSDACRKLDFPLSSMNRVLREGLGENPRVRTVEVLTKLGLIELVKRAS